MVNLVYPRLFMLLKIRPRPPNFKSLPANRTLFSLISVHRYFICLNSLVGIRFQSTDDYADIKWWKAIPNFKFSWKGLSRHRNRFPGLCTSTMNNCSICRVFCMKHCDILKNVVWITKQKGCVKDLVIFLCFTGYWIPQWSIIYSTCWKILDWHASLAHLS